MIGPLNPQERKVLLFICFILGLGIFFGYYKKTTGCNTCLIDVYSSRRSGAFDINLVTRDELLSVPGIGPKAADDVLARRAVLGGFSSMNQLEDVKGLDPAGIKILKAYTYIKNNQ